ncbi:unnamed protein product [Meloidogyne enterolobii]|uniref:Uncharacterized protein n=1 Tax=Meloidogyne enterolobii TaxID=390850 RepID=A0ACB0XR44_MELEN
MSDKCNKEMFVTLIEEMEQKEDVEEIAYMILANINLWANDIHEVNKKLVADKKLEPIFTTNPNELKGKIINICIKKDSNFGIGYIGMRGTCTKNEFIQIATVDPETPAYISGALPGDIICILGARREEVYKILDSFSVGDTVNFQLCRGYAMQETVDNRIYIMRGISSCYFSFITSPAWHYLLVDKDKKEAFLGKCKTGSMDVANYGQILYSGWGKDPPQDIKDKLNEEYGTGSD